MAGVKGRSGRKRTPSPILRLHGTLRTRENRNPAGEPQPEVERPDMPKFLTGEARLEWERIVPLLLAEKCLTQWDRAALSSYCQTWKEYVRLCLAINRITAYTITTDKGNLVQNPLVGAKNRAFNNLLRICGEFGLTPASRSRLNINPGQGEVDPLAELLRRRQAIAGS